MVILGSFCIFGFKTQRTKLQALNQSPAGAAGDCKCDKGGLLSLDLIRLLCWMILWSKQVLSNTFCSAWALLLHNKPGQIWICNPISISRYFALCYRENKYWFIMAPFQTLLTPLPRFLACWVKNILANKPVHFFPKRANDFVEGLRGPLCYLFIHTQNQTFLLVEFFFTKEPRIWRCISSKRDL